ncbi:hypothetical protein [uncultured Massilia sp.]|uniref:hypothetical protein n=1 Tax=uncultured Massilia sp. TaxID=169973 RepID=UPI0025867ABA|nr:hypothetical protein [uncultured Massilia sp.]
MTKARRPNVLRQAFLLAALCLSAQGAGAQEAASYADLATGLRFPKMLGQLGYQRMVTFGDDKLGYCVLYAHPEARAQLCVYDMGHKNLPTGVDSAPFKEALGLAVQGTIISSNKAPFSNGKEIASGTPSIEADGRAAKAEMRMFTSDMAQLDGSVVRQTHLILMTTGLGKFLKLNYTSRRGSDAFALESRQFVEDFVRFNGDTMKQLLLASPPAP